jgi:hypothetical protein
MHEHNLQLRAVPVAMWEGTRQWYNICENRSEHTSILYKFKFAQQRFCSTDNINNKNADEHTLLSGTSELERVLSRDMMAVTARVTILMSSSPSMSAGAEFRDSCWQSSCFCSTIHKTSRCDPLTANTIQFSPDRVKVRPLAPSQNGASVEWLVLSEICHFVHYKYK